MKSIMLRFVSLVVVLSMLLAGCTSTPTQPPAAQPAQPASPTAKPVAAPQTPFVLANSTDIDTLDPHKFNAMWTRSIGYWVFDTLVMAGAGGEPIPELAHSWKRLDLLTWEFYLVKGVKFHNGEPFNAEVVKWNLTERMVDKENMPYSYIYQLGALDTVKVIDEYTVQLITKEPVSEMLWVLGRTFMAPKKYYTDNDSKFLARNPVGSGPYKFVEWVADKQIKFVANEEYFQGAPKIKEAFVKIIPEDSSRVNEMVAGNIDMIYTLKADLAKQANSAKSRLVTVNTLRKMYIGFMMNEKIMEPLKNKKVREALNYAVNRQAIIDAYFFKGTEPGGFLINKPNHNPAITAFPFDPAKAKQLLAEAGYANGFKAKFYASNNIYGSDKEIAQVLADNLRDVGINIELVIQENNTQRDMLSKKVFDGFFYNGDGTYPEPLPELRQVQCLNKDNHAQHCNKEADAVVDELQKTIDPAKRKELIQKAEKMLWDDYFRIYLFNNVTFMGMSNRTVYTPYPDGYVDLWQVTYK